MKIILRVILTYIGEIKFRIRNFFYKSLFEVGENTIFLGRVFYYHPKFISIGKNCSINEGVFFNAGTKIIIHDNVAISAGVFLTSVGGGIEIQNNMSKTYHDYGIIEIGTGSWIGANAIILHGVKIGKNCIIAAGSVVNTDVKDGMIVVGNPARVSAKVTIKKAI
jgi:maltose O-acetyltransferase